MNFKQQLLICTVMTISITGCGGSDSPSGNAPVAAAPTIDGPKQVLSENEDSFIPTASNDNSLFNVSAPSTLNYRASTTMQLQITSNSAQPCNINIYKDYDTLPGPTFTPAPSGKVIQINSDTCSYSGQIYILKQQQKLLAEVVSLQNATTTYSEVLLNGNTITLNLD
ncbi:hypothetical protein [Moritella sp. F3]|uniref:hypothetical protein n=1 Tax=Moritella sp. F3 TaxID=2718882 RepID=UPI0018E17086|nr:hypothetical protein [Moritella sp. F3]GIC82642.1 hypothetical protein FMO003_29230 [Moritella sp. F3]